MYEEVKCTRRLFLALRSSNKIRVIPMLLWCALGVLLQISCAAAPPSTAVPLGNPELYIIYDEVLKEHARINEALTVSIVRFTQSKLPDLGRCLARADSSQQWQFAVNDLRRQNVSTYVIEPKFEVPFKYELADQMEEVGGDRQPPPGKDHFVFLREEMAKLKKLSDERFTQVEMSVPGISDDHQVAIVYLAVSWGGGFHVLRKKENIWGVDTKPLCGWVS